MGQHRCAEIASHQPQKAESVNVQDQLWERTWLPQWQYTVSFDHHETHCGSGKCAEPCAFDSTQMSLNRTMEKETAAVCHPSAECSSDHTPHRPTSSNRSIELETAAYGAASAACSSDHTPTPHRPTTPEPKGSKRRAGGLARNASRKL